MAVLQPSQDFGSIAHKVWPWSMIRGGIAVVFGIIGFAWLLPMDTLRTFAFAVGIFAILDGLANVVEAARRRGGPMILRGLAGLVGIAFGILAMAWLSGQSPTAITTMIWMVGIWAFVIGGLELITNLLDRGADHRDWVFGMIMGIVAMAFGVLAVVTMPTLTGLIWYAAIATIVWGIAALIMGGNERRFARQH